MSESSTQEYLITVEDFKNYFKKDFDYADESESSSSSSSDNIDSLLVYNEDIEKAIQEAGVNFNQNLFSTKKTAILCFKYLTAFYLTLDQNNANSCGNSGGVGILSSRQVRNVSESFSVPQWVLSNPLYSMYAQNGYGVKYLSLILPYLIAPINVVPGATLP